jgi:hypothetical protein
MHITESLLSGKKLSTITSYNFHDDCLLYQWMFICFSPKSMVKKIN